MRRLLLAAGSLLILVTGLTLMARANAQTTSVEIRNGEVLAVDGDVVTVRGPQGVKQFVIPADYRFEMNGRKLSVLDLKPGMKYSAVITTTETPIDVTTTEVKQAKVLFTTGQAIVVQDVETKEIKKFTTDQLRSRNLVLYKDGKQIEPSQLRKGDRLSATIVTKNPPEIVTEQDVTILLSHPTAPPAAVPDTPPPAANPAPAPSTEPAATPQPEPAAPPPAANPAPAPSTEPATPPPLEPATAAKPRVSVRLVVLVVVGLLVLIAGAMALRRRS